MDLNFKIEHCPGKHFVGLKREMSLSQNQTAELWRSFMPLKAQIPALNSDELYALQVYPPRYFDAFNPALEFEKWALVEAEQGVQVEGLENFELEAGLYAVFHYQGMSNDPRIFQEIYSVWLPQSGYILDQRPHFEVLGKGYRNLDPLSEEEIWIPVKKSKGEEG